MSHAHDRPQPPDDEPLADGLADAAQDAPVDGVEAGAAAAAVAEPVPAAGASPAPGPDGAAPRPRRVRPKPGERRLQILQTLAEMLQQPGGERVTTAALAGRLKVSEAALYRHFASKAQMFEGLIEFIEGTVLGLINRIAADHPDGVSQLRATVSMLLQFAERNPGMTRVLIGDALVTEDDRLQGRINQLVDRIETSLKQGFRVAVAQGALPEGTDVAARAGLIVAFVIGRWSRYAKSGFKRVPSEGLDAIVPLLVR